VFKKHLRYEIREPSILCIISNEFKNESGLQTIVSLENNSLTKEKSQ
jgi:hypothetical protein